MAAVQDGLFDDLPFPPPERPAASAPASSGVEPAAASEALRGLGAALPAGLYFGTSSWSYAGWVGSVYGRPYSDSRLARQGLPAYAAHPLLRSVGLDRGFYAPLSVQDYARYAGQVPPGFRFLVKAPALVTDATVRGEHGEPAQANAAFLDATLATDQFVLPCLEGLGEKAGVLLFQFPPLPRSLLAQVPAFVERLRAFFTALPRGPLYAAEFRDGAVVTPRMIQMLDEVGVRYGIGLHARMPAIERQARAVAAQGAGPLVVRWVLHEGLDYAGAKRRYSPFDRLVDEDPATRERLAALIAQTLRAGQPVFVILNNKAEGSAPLSIEALARSVRQALGVEGEMGAEG